MRIHPGSHTNIMTQRRLLVCLLTLLCSTGSLLASSQPRLPLERAALAGDLPRVKRLLEEGQGQYSRDSALGFAIQAGHLEIIDLLIAKGASGALAKAAEKGDLALVKRFLAQGQEAKALDSGLHAAARMRHNEIVEVLLAAGADINARRWGNLTPLFFVVKAQRSGYAWDWIQQPRRQRVRNATNSSEALEMAKFLVARGAEVDVDGGNPALPLLFYAVHGGNLNIVGTLIAHGAKADTQPHLPHQDSRLTSALHLAADYGDLPMCKLLIKHGAKVNVQSPEVEGGSYRNARETPLHHAAAAGNAELVTFLLDQGAELNAVSGWGRTPLHDAVLFGTPATVEALLARGAKVNTATETGQTPLHSAAAYKDHAAVEQLLAHGAAPNPRDEQGQTPLSIAIRNGSEEIVKLLAPQQDRMTLHSAASLGALETMAALLDSGIEVDSIDTEGRTALHAAVKAGQVSAVKWLLAQGADASARDERRVSPVTIALRIAQHHSFSRDPNEVARFETLKDRQRQILPLLVRHSGAPDFSYGIPQEALLTQSARVARLLIDAGVNFEPHGDTAGTVLHRAAWWGREQVVADLLALGADVHATDRYGATPLHAATQSGSTRYWDVISGPHAEVLELLLRHGAPVDAVNDANETALHGAASHCHLEAVELLVRHGADVNARNKANATPLHVGAAAYRGAFDVIDLLIAQGADPNAVDDKGNTALLLLLSRRTMEAEEKAETADYVVKLVGQGLRVNVQNDQGVTPLHQAAALESPALLEAFLSHGAAVNTPSTEGWTALHSAVTSGNEKCVEILLAHGAHIAGAGRLPDGISLPILNRPAHTPLEIAVAEGHSDIIRQLIAAGADGEDSLYLAYQRNRLATFKRLLESGVDGNVLTPNGDPLIYIAAAKQQREIVEALLKHGAQADAELVQALLETGTTPLHLAAWAGDLDRVKELVAQGMRLDIRDRKRLHAISRAHDQRHVEVVEFLLPRMPASVASALLFSEVEKNTDEMIPLLIAHGADVNVKGLFEESSLLHLVAWNSNRKIMELLLAHGADVNVLDRGGLTPLARAVQARKGEMVAMLLAHGADCNTVAPDRSVQRGRSPLHFAVFRGSFEIAEMLVQAGADVNIRDKREGLTPLHMALRNQALFDLMLDHGGQIDCRSQGGQTPLHMAADQGLADLTSYLLAKEATIDVQDNRGNTPLHLAARRGHRDVCEILLRHKADTRIQNLDHRRAFDYARASELDELFDQLNPNAD